MLQLPHKLSELARIALDDVVAVSQLPGFTIRLCEWYAPRRSNCMICVAGAVMVQRLGCTRRSSISSPGELAREFGPHNARALLAIDMLRRGNVGHALACIERGMQAWYDGLELADQHELSCGLDPAPEDDTDKDGLPPIWVEAMGELIDDLEKAGL